MQLRQYWEIIRRRWLVVALVVGLAALGGGLLLALTPRQYSTEVRFLVNREPTQPVATSPAATPYFRYDDIYRFQGTEYALDDLVEQLRGNVFAAAMSEGLQARGVGNVTTTEVERALKPDRAHRTLTLEVATRSRELTRAMADVAEELLTQKADRFAPPDGSHVSVRLIHRDPMTHSNLLRAALTYALQVALALLLGLGLAFLLHYLDDRAHDPRDAQALGVPLLGHLPSAR